MNERECVAFLRVRFPRLLSCRSLYTFTFSLFLSLSIFLSVCLLILSFFRPGARSSRSLRPLRQNSDARKIRLARIDRFSKGNRANECRKIALFTFNYLPVYLAINKITRLMKYVPVSARLISLVRFERFVPPRFSGLLLELLRFYRCSSFCERRADSLGIKFLSFTCRFRGCFILDKFRRHLRSVRLLEVIARILAFLSEERWKLYYYMCWKYLK